MSKTSDRKALGKGLSALLPARSQTQPAEPSPGQALQTISIDLVDANPVQPRTIFETDKLQELAQSIQSNGIIQPLVVQRTGDRYQLIAGERRWRAAKIAGLQQVPVVVRDFSPDRLLEVALIENIQREDLNPIELAQALDRLVNEYHLSHEEVGKRTGKDRTTVTNLLRLLKLPGEIQVLLAEHRLSMGHARALLGLNSSEEQLVLAEQAAAQGMSVRQVERLVHAKTARRKSGDETDQPVKSARDPNVTAATRDLEAALGTRVRIVSQSGGRGKIEIDYFSTDELDRIFNLLTGNR